MFRHEVYTTVEIEFKGVLLCLSVWGNYSYDKGDRYEPPSEEMILSEIEGIVFEKGKHGYKHKSLSRRLYSALEKEFGDYFEERLLEAVYE